MNTDKLKRALEANNVSMGDDVFVHGTNLIDGLTGKQYTIEEFAEKIFAEGLLKNSEKTGDGRSILSTIALLSQEKSLEEKINDYILGNYTVILKIPTELEHLYLGKCAKIYSNAGNQYGKHSLLDYLDLEYIPSGFIVGIFCKSNKHFIQNPNYFDYYKNKDENTKKLVQELETAMDKNNCWNVVTDIIRNKFIDDETFLMLESRKFTDIINFLLEREELYFERRQAERESELSL